MNNRDNILLLIGSWFNAILGSLTSVEPILSAFAYIFSIIGSIVYIWVTLKNKKNEKIN